MKSNLVSYLLFAYNQEEYIREAVLAALSQDYEHLELIFSDDCSSDRTFHIIEDLARTYQGSHKIVLNRNRTNLGVTRHLNKLVDMSSGRLIVGAAGDDISEINRVSTLVKRWQRSGRLLISSNATLIDEQGKVLGEYSANKTRELTHKEMIREGRSGVLGATVAWDRRLFEMFGTHPTSTINEDQLLPFRAALQGGIEYVNKPLVRYRIHGRNLSNWLKDADGSNDSLISGRETQIKNLISTYKNWEDTLVNLNRSEESCNYESELTYLNRMQALLNYHLKILRSNGLGRLRYCWRALRACYSSKDIIKTIIVIISPVYYSKLLGRK